MIPLLLSRPRPHLPTLPLLSPLSTSLILPACTRIPNQRNLSSRRRRRWGICLAELSADAPFAIAIGASILSSLVLPATITTTGDGSDWEEEEERDGVLGGSDTRFAVMGIISLIPYFNWLSWVFAWMDTGKRRYVVYAIVYLAPYFRSNLSLSPEESWLPIASILLCIMHVQLEASINSGDLDGFLFFKEIAKRLSSTSKFEDNSFDVDREIKEKGKEKDDINLPYDSQHQRDEVRKWRLPKIYDGELEHENEDVDAKGKGKHGKDN